MSDSHANRPSIDSHLPEELARCESMLGGMSLPRSRVDRDELIYQAGWAAAQADAQSPSVRGAERKQFAHGASRRSTLVWSVASAAVAASLTLAVTLRLQPAANAPAEAVVSASPADASAIGGEEEPMESLADPVPDGFTLGTGVTWTASLLIMRDRALLQQWDDPWIVSASETSFAASSSDDAIPSQPITSREILQEFLPEPSAQDTSDRNSTRRALRWPWITTPLGETT